MTDQNCRNCGAPLTRDGDCEYCGTQRQRRMTGGIEITVDRITFFADDQAIGTCVTRNWPQSRTERGYGT